jgi:hypothetical protein
MGNLFQRSILAVGLMAFGITPPMAETLYSEDFENETILGEISDGFHWTDKSYVLFIEDPTETGNHVAQFILEGSEAGDAWAELRFDLGGLYKEIWMKYRMYIPDNYYHRDSPSSDNNKGFYLWSGEYNNGADVLVSASWWRMDDGSTKMMGNWKTNSETSKHYNDEDLDSVIIDLESDLGRWHDIVIRVRIADPGIPNGALQVWKNDSPIWSDTSIENYAADSSMNGVEKGYLLGWSNSGFDEDTKLLIDDFIIGETPEDIGFEYIRTQPLPPTELEVSSADEE